MSDTLRDQLLGLGFKPAPKPERKPHPLKRGEDRSSRGAAGRKPETRKLEQRKARSGGAEMDLAKAYAIRAQREKEEHIEAERQKQEAARLRREAQARLDDYLATVAPLADEAADIARHFEYGGKIKRIYVTADQLKSLNAGGLGVLQRRGRYLLVTAEVLAKAEAIFPDAVALKVDPTAPAEDDPYGDPKYQVPDDLVW